MDGNSILATGLAIMIAIGSTIKYLIGRIDTSKKELNLKIDTSNKEVIDKIDDIKREYVSHVYLESEIKHLAETQKEIKQQIKDQGDKIIGLLSRRRED